MSESPSPSINHYAPVCAYNFEMGLLSKKDILTGLQRLGELALNEGTEVELLVVGGGAMVLGYNARLSTRDLDAVILSPERRDLVRQLVEVVAGECRWPADWLNDGAKGFLVSPEIGATLFIAPGITVRMPTTEVLLAMKLCAWRDDVDVSDARRLLAELSGSHSEIWSRVSKHLPPGRELKARMAFEDLVGAKDDSAG